MDDFSVVVGKRIEIGALTLRRIADALHKPVDYFFVPFESALVGSVSQTAARSHKPLPKKAGGGKRDAA